MKPLFRMADVARRAILGALLLAAVACVAMAGCAAAPESTAKPKPQTVPEWLSQQRPG